MTRKEIYNRIISIAHQTVQSRNCSFSADAEKQLEELVLKGVNNTMSDTDVNDPEKVALAEKNMQKLCNVLCDDAIEGNHVLKKFNRNIGKRFIKNNTEMDYIVNDIVFSSARCFNFHLWPFF